MRIIMVGGGKKVFFLAKSFISKGYKVTIINDELDKCKQLSRTTNATVVHGDASNYFVMEDANVQLADMVIAITDKDANNLVICEMAKKMYDVKRCIAVVNDPKNVEIFKKFGIDTVISTAQIISSLIEQRASLSDIHNLFPIDEGQAAVLEISVKVNFAVVGKMLKDIVLPKESLIGCIIRDGTAVIPRGDSVILENDNLIMISLPNVQSHLLEAVTGRKE